MQYVIALILVSFSAMFSGMTLGFFSLSKDDLMRKAELGDRRAKNISRLREKGNLLLCTLLVGNVIVNSTLSIYLGSIASGVIAGFIAIGLIVIFGEILPMAVFSRFALDIGARMYWFAIVMRTILLPITWPIAWVLDRLLGAELSTIYSKQELMKLIEDHEEHEHGTIDADEERILQGALSFSDKTVADIMTTRKKIKFFDADEKMTKKVVEKIRRAGHSRFPVFDDEKDKVVGILYAKDLVGRKVATKTIRDMARKPAIFVSEDLPLDSLLNKFKRSRTHLFGVTDRFGLVVGLVTIEDVLEEIIGAEIRDEFEKD